MARIRSVHPGLFTDEAFVALSPAARLLLIGIWTEADDHGVFEWKPLSLKMRIFPADNFDVEQLLAEIESRDQIKCFTCDNRSFGVIRNFCKYQRPKKPTYRYSLPDEYGTYVGLKTQASPPVPHQFPTSTEKSPQMEDGGGREGGRKKESKEERADARCDIFDPPVSIESPSGLATKYAFDGTTVRLNQVHFDNWKRSFSNLDLRAELIARDAWLSSDRATDDDRKNWFVSTPKYLANRNMEAKAMGQKGAFKWASGIEGVY